MSNKVKLNCKAELKQLDGKTIKDQITKRPATVGEAISTILIQSKNTELSHLKKWNLAQDFFNNEEIEIDTSDFGTIKNIVKEDTTFGTLVLGQIEELFTKIS